MSVPFPLRVGRVRGNLKILLIFNSLISKDDENIFEIFFSHLVGSRPSRIVLCAFDRLLLTKIRSDAERETQLRL